MDILISILIPGVPQHLPATVRLLEVLSAQPHPQVEVLLYYDNMKRPLGCKRNALMDQAQGKYLCHIDDDDLVSANFISTLLPECEHDVDLIAYDADCSLNGAPPFRVFTVLGAANEQPKHLAGGRYSNIVRTPWTWCLWRTSLARECRYIEQHDPVEDATFLNQALPRVQSHRKVDRILYHHIYSSAGTSFK
jgi:glycosyltransferase involved in cell wall biosynthesis